MVPRFIHIVAFLTLLTYARVDGSQSFEHDPMFESSELMLELLEPPNFAGVWKSNSFSKDNKATISGFESIQGLMIIRTQGALILLDGNDPFETRFIFIQLNIVDLIQRKKWIQIFQGESVGYVTGLTGGDLGGLNVTILNAQECIMEGMAIIMTKTQNFEEVDSLTNESHFVIQVSIVGGECPF